jgi:proline dehydrogenase
MEKDSMEYQLYLDFLPKAKMFAKYIKGKKMNKYNKDLVTVIANHYQIARIEAEQYIDLMEQSEITELLKRYGKQEKEIKGLLK